MPIPPKQNTKVFSLDEQKPFSNIAETHVDEVKAFVDTRIDWKETSNEYVFRVQRVGLKIDEVKVYIKPGRILEIRGERKMEEKQGRRGGLDLLETRTGKFVKKFHLPDEAVADETKANLDVKGVLTVTVPKRLEKMIELI